jgi:hypothetical protein
LIAEAPVEERARASRQSPPWLLKKRERVAVGQDCGSQYTPPPLKAEFPLIVQFMIVGEAVAQYIPPP